MNKREPKQTLSQELGLIEEVRIGFKFVKRGLREIDLILPGNDFYHPPMLFLATGIERILKCMICMEFKERTGFYPTTNDKLWLKGKQGHNLIQLKDTVVKFCIPLNGAAKEDHRVLACDPMVNSFLRLLSDYGSDTRYYNLNALLTGSISADPMRSYDRFTGDLGFAVFGKTLMAQIEDPLQARKAYESMNIATKALIERFTRALARQFIFGTFKNQSKRFLFEIDPFHKLEDQELGTRFY